MQRHSASPGSGDYDDFRFPRSGPAAYRLLLASREALLRRFERAALHPREAQERVLARLLRALRGSLQGRELGVERLRGYEDFRRRVPPRDYEAYRPYVERVAAGERRVLTREPVLQFVETSGSTGRPKWIPVTPGYARAVAGAQALWVLSLLAEHPGLARKAPLTLVSPAVKGRTAGGVAYGANTGRMHLAQPWWLRRRYPVPYAAYTLPGPEQRLYAVLRFALQAELGSITTANPTTLLLLARRLREHRDDLAADLEAGTLRHGPAAALPPELRAPLERRLRRRRPPEDWRPARIWPLEVLACWTAGSAGYFLPLLPRAMGAELPVREVGLTASETFAGIALADHWEGCAAWPLGEFLEFADEAGGIHPLWELEQGATYRLLPSGLHGLLRYELGDLVRVVGRYRRLPVLRFLRRAGNVLSATGEKLTEEQLLEAVARLAAGLGLPPPPFTASLELAELPRLELAVELEGGPPAEELGRLLDDELRRLNVEYDEKRASGRLAPPRLHPLPPGTYARLRARAVAGGTPEGQYKEPVVAMDRALWERVLEAGREVAGQS